MMKSMTGGWRLDAFLQDEDLREDRTEGFDDLSRTWIHDVAEAPDDGWTSTSGVILRIGDDGRFTESVTAERSPEIPWWDTEGTGPDPHPHPFDGSLLKSGGRIHLLPKPDAAGYRGADDPVVGSYDVDMTQTLHLAGDGSLIRTVSVNFEDYALSRAWYRYRPDSSAPTTRPTRVEDSPVPSLDDGEEVELPSELADALVDWFVAEADERGLGTVGVTLAISYSVYRPGNTSAVGFPLGWPEGRSLGSIHSPHDALGQEVQDRVTEYLYESHLDRLVENQEGHRKIGWAAAVHLPTRRLKVRAFTGAHGWGFFASDWSGSSLARRLYESTGWPGMTDQ